METTKALDPKALPPCPFCGGAAEWNIGQKGDGSPWHYLACEDCEAIGPHVNINAAEAWSRRASLSAQPAAPDHAGLVNVCQCENTITESPCIVCGKPKLVTKAWVERMAAKEEVATTVRLDDCPEGLFLFNGSLGFMSEYATTTPHGHRVRDAYVVSSGEYFWGGTSCVDKRGDLMVTPVLYAEAIAALSRVQEPVAVKPLEWRRVDGNWYADRYRIWEDIGAPSIFVVSGWDSGTNPYDTLDAAKAAAQADYERRIRSALATPPAPQGDAAKPAADGLVAMRGELATVLVENLTTAERHRIIDKAVALIDTLPAASQEGGDQ